MQKLLIATANPGKVTQYRAQLSDLSVELVTVADLNLGNVEETGKTFEENVLLKVRAYHQASGLPCIGDDGGLEIDALGGEPGVYSRRWKTGDESATDQELIDYTIEKMKDVPEGKRSARFKMVMAFADANGKEYLAEAAAEGFVPLTPSSVILAYMPFDSVLYIPQFNKIRSELSDEEHNQINQRVQAIQKLKPIIAKSLA
ncbi:MAG TPA: non-canonical purine NTP pyrophosphatase, partial [Candidatus Paceibacterota bacterium]|nr:non-canonical purine NTP pyrophosphatase [Candidatus Paceibacterota bacterium]